MQGWPITERHGSACKKEDKAEHHIEKLIRKKINGEMYLLLTLRLPTFW